MDLISLFTSVGLTLILCTWQFLYIHNIILTSTETSTETELVREVSEGSSEANTIYHELRSRQGSGLFSDYCLIPGLSASFVWKLNNLKMSLRFPCWILNICINYILMHSIKPFSFYALFFIRSSLHVYTSSWVCINSTILVISIWACILHDWKLIRHLHWHFIHSTSY